MRFVLRPTLETTADGALVIHREGLTLATCVGLGFVGLAIPGLLVYLAVGPVWGQWAFGELVTGKICQTGIALLCLLMMALCVRELYPDLPCGVWRIDAAGVTFQSEAGLDHQVAWAEVERVWWTGRWIGLVTPHDRITLTVYNRVQPEWKAVADRVEAELSPRFDLTFRKEASGEFHLRRVVPVLIVVALAAWGFVRLAPLLTDRQLRELSLGLLMVSFSVKLSMIGWIQTVRANRINPFWRTPRPQPAPEHG